MAKIERQRDKSRVQESGKPIKQKVSSKIIKLVKAGTQKSRVRM